MSGWRNDPVGLPLAGRPPGIFGPATSAGPTLGFLCLLGLLGPFLPACSKHAPATDVLRISQRNEPATLDPQLATLPDEFFIIRALSEGLLVPDPDGGAPRPGAAESWSVSPDGLTYTFHLRPGALWSNGEPVTAQNFAWSIQRVLAPGLAAPKAALFFPIKNADACYLGHARAFDSVGVRTPDTHTLQLELAHSNPDFPAIVASGPWIPIHPATVSSLRTGHPAGYVGNGPFTFVAWRPNQEIVVARNPAYWDAANVRLREIRFLAFDNGDSEERAFRAGQLDVTLSVPFSKLAPYRAARPPVLRTTPLHEIRYLALNTRRPPLNRTEVRLALALALDRRILAEKVLQGGQRPAYSFIPPGLGGYTPAHHFSEDAAEARQFLAEAGFPSGRGFPRLELSAWAVSPVVLEAIQQMWRHELGLEVTLVQREAKTHLAALATGDYDIGFMTAIPDYNGASDLFTELTSGNPGNYPRWSSVKFDQLVTAAQATADPGRRLALRREAEELLLGEMPLIPLYFNAKNILIQPAVQGWQEDALWTRFYKNVQLHEK